MIKEIENLKYLGEIKRKQGYETMSNVAQYCSIRTSMVSVDISNASVVLSKTLVQNKYAQKLY